MCCNNSGLLRLVCGERCPTQGSHAPGKSWKVMDFLGYNFQVLESPGNSSASTQPFVNQLCSKCDIS